MSLLRRLKRLDIENAFGLVDYLVAGSAFNSVRRILNWRLFSRLSQKKASWRYPFDRAGKLGDILLRGWHPTHVTALSAPATVCSGRSATNRASPVHN